MTRRPAALVAVAAAAAGLFALVALGVVPTPDLDEALTDLSDTLGTWTYALVGGLAFLETGAFVGLVAPGETAVVLGGVVAARGGVDLAPMLLIVWLSAAAGDFASFMLGRKLGRRFLVARGPRLGITPDRLARVDSFFDQARAQGDPRRPLHRHHPGCRAVPGRLLRHAAARLPPVEPARHRRVGDCLRRRRLRVRGVVQLGGRSR